MAFSVGDKVVHPHHGPGWIVGMVRRDLMDGAKAYYVIEVPGQALTVHIPASRVDDVGVRLAMSPSNLPRVLSLLRGKPRQLPADYRERQEQIEAEIRTGQVMELAQVVRDLTWHKAQAHLTKRDADLLRQGQDLLAAEMALVSDQDTSAASRLIESTVAAALAAVPGQAQMES